ncbi:MAG: DUF1802 family protein [Actinobacteria bacterium]|nr:DUF1802 family protein [Actinomycetota bacterium]
MGSITVATTLALKEWAAVVHALLDGRQTVLLRKGGIREKRFDVTSDRFVLFPTVAHAHAERVRAGHDDVLDAGRADVDDNGGRFVVRAGVELVDVIPIADAAALATLTDLHIWTHEHIAERLAFRPKHALQVLVVDAIALDNPLELVRTPEYGGCTSWVDLPLRWDGRGTRVHPRAHLDEVAARIRGVVA